MHIAFGEKIAIPSHVARTVSKNKVFVVVYYNHKIGLILVHFYLQQKRKVDTSKLQTHSLPTDSKANSRGATVRPATLKPTDNICIDTTSKEKELNSQTSHFAYISPPHSTASSNKTRSNSQETTSQKTQSHSRKTQSHSREAHSHSEETHSHSQASEKVSHIQTQTVHSGTRERKSINLEEDFLSLSAINGASPRRDPLANNKVSPIIVA